MEKIRGMDLVMLGAIVAILQHVDGHGMQYMILSTLLMGIGLWNVIRGD